MAMKTCIEFIGSKLQIKPKRSKRMNRSGYGFEFCVIIILLCFTGCNVSGNIKNFFPYEIKDGFEFWKLPNSCMSICGGKPKSIRISQKAGQEESLYEICFNGEMHPDELHSRDTEVDIIEKYKYNNGKLESVLVIDGIKRTIIRKEIVKKLNGGVDEYSINNDESKQIGSWKISKRGNTIYAEQYSEYGKFLREVDWHYGLEGIDMIEECNEGRNSKRRVSAEIFRTKVEYNKYGEIIETQQFAVKNGEEKLIDKREYYYNEKRLTEMRRSADGVDLKYRFEDWDKNGNWRKMVDENGDCIMEREISYY